MSDTPPQLSGCGHSPLIPQDQLWRGHGVMHHGNVTVGNYDSDCVFISRVH